MGLTNWQHPGHKYPSVETESKLGTHVVSADKQQFNYHEMMVRVNEHLSGLVNGGWEYIVDRHIASQVV